MQKRELKKPEEGPVQGKFPKEPAAEGRQSAELKRVRSKLYAAKIDEALENWKENLAPLMKCLKDDNVNVRMNAKYAFDRVHDEAVRAVIGELGKSWNMEFWVVASDALGERALDRPNYDWGPTALALNKGMMINNSKIYEHASAALMNLGEKAIPIFTKDLSASKDRLRWRAATTLEKIAERHPEYDWGAATIELVGSLSDDEEWAREEACKALGKMGEYALKELKKGMERGSPASRKYFMEAFGLVGDVSVFGILLEALNDDEDNVRDASLAALCKIAERHPEEVAAHITNLINGKMGDELLGICERNERIINALHNSMVVCAMRMREAE